MSVTTLLQSDTEEVKEIGGRKTTVSEAFTKSIYSNECAVTTYLTVDATVVTFLDADCNFPIEFIAISQEKYKFCFRLNRN